MTHAQQPSDFVSEPAKRYGTNSWVSAEWVKNLFYSNPMLVSLAERQPSGHFGYDFVMVVKVPGGFRHRYIDHANFNYTDIREKLSSFVESYPELNSRWLEDTPSAAGMLVVVNRGRLGLSDAESTVIGEQKEKVLEENRDWMEPAFANYPGLTRIVKSANTRRSPTTFALCFNNGDPHHTWMKDPTFDRVRIRMKIPRDGLRASPPREIWVPGAGPAEGLEFTREDFAKTSNEAKEECAACGAHAVRGYGLTIRGNYERHMLCPKCSCTDSALVEVAIVKRTGGATAAAEPAPQEVAPPADCCTECGVSFEYNLQFGRGDEKLCGECELKHDEENGERRVHLEFVFKRRRPPVRKRNPRFDPRPGIDDVGLGGSGPNWED